MLKTKVKASAITNLTDARYFAAWEVAWMGFDLNPASDTFISPTQVLAVKEWIEGPKIVGEFGDQSTEEIEKLAVDLQLDAIQAGMNTPLETLLELDTDIPVIKEISVDRSLTPDELQSMLQDFSARVQLFLLDLTPGGWTPAGWQGADGINESFIREIAGQYPIILSMDIPASDLEDLLDRLPLRGYAVRGGTEEKVGYKSFDDLDEIFEALEELV